MLMVESEAKLAGAPWHRQKPHLVLSAISQPGPAARAKR